MVGTRSPRGARSSRRSLPAAVKLSWLLHLGPVAARAWTLCCDSSAALGMIKRKGSTRKTRHIELKAFFLEQWNARPEVRLVQVETSEMLADCLTKIQSTPNSTQLETWTKTIERRRDVEIPLTLLFDSLVSGIWQESHQQPRTPLSPLRVLISLHSSKTYAHRHPSTCVCYADTWMLTSESSCGRSVQKTRESRSSRLHFRNPQRDRAFSNYWLNHINTEESRKNVARYRR